MRRYNFTEIQKHIFGYRKEFKACFNIYCNIYSKGIAIWANRDTWGDLGQLFQTGSGTII